MWPVSWQIKASKFCNLRCRYCYEWNELADTQRIGVDGWQKILVAINRYHQLQTRRFDEGGQTSIVWHGGEPLALPIPYWQQVLDVAHEILTDHASGAFNYVVQTNLYSLPEALLGIFEREKFRVSVSLDLAPGVRTTIDGRETAERILANIQRLRQREIQINCQVVLGGHTHDRLCQIHDTLAELGIAFTIVPMFDAPLLPTSPELTISTDQCAAALEKLFVHWIESGCRVPIYNLSACLNTVLMHMAGLERLAWDAQRNGERVFMVNTDGALWSIVERYQPGRSIGNLFSQTIDEILDSPAYEASLQRREELLQLHCHQCPYRGACDGEPILTIPHNYPAGPCPIAARLCRFIENYLRLAGYDEEQVVSRLPKTAIATARI